MTRLSVFKNLFKLIFKNNSSGESTSYEEGRYANQAGAKEEIIGVTNTKGMGLDWIRKKVRKDKDKYNKKQVENIQEKDEKMKEILAKESLKGNEADVEFSKESAPEEWSEKNATEQRTNIIKAKMHKLTLLTTSPEDGMDLAGPEDAMETHTFKEVMKDIATAISPQEHGKNDPNL